MPNLWSVDQSQDQLVDLAVRCHLGLFKSPVALLVAIEGRLDRHLNGIADRLALRVIRLAKPDGGVVYLLRHFNDVPVMNGFMGADAVDENLPPGGNLGGQFFGRFRHRIGDGQK